MRRNLVSILIPDRLGTVHKARYVGKNEYIKIKVYVSALYAQNPVILLENKSLT
jgi:hypothetical protein